MRSHRLKLNTAKTEVIWLTAGRRMHQLPQQPLRVGSDLITPVLVVRDLGIYGDADASMRSHVMRTTPACFAVLRQLRASAARYIGLSSSPWCRVWCYGGWTIATQYWPAFHYTLFGASSQWWTRPHSSRTLRGLLVIKVRSHHAAPTPTSLADGLLTDRLQAGRSCL